MHRTCVRCALRIVELELVRVVKNEQTISVPYLAVGLGSALTGTPDECGTVSTCWRGGCSVGTEWSEHWLGFLFEMWKTLDLCLGSKDGGVDGFKVNAGC